MEFSPFFLWNMVKNTIFNPEGGEIYSGGGHKSKGGGASWAPPPWLSLIRTKINNKCAVINYV